MAKKTELIGYQPRSAEQGSPPQGGSAMSYHPAIIKVEQRPDGKSPGIRVCEDGNVEYLDGYSPDDVTRELWTYLGKTLAQMWPRNPRDAPKRWTGGET